MGPRDGEGARHRGKGKSGDESGGRHVTQSTSVQASPGPRQAGIDHFFNRIAIQGNISRAFDSVGLVWGLGIYRFLKHSSGDLRTTGLEKCHSASRTV